MNNQTPRQAPQDLIATDDDSTTEWKMQYLLTPQPMCKYRYANGRRCNAGPNSHKWWNGRSHIEVSEPDIFDHWFTEFE